jgi:photosystem II stability/assembly factor-like uncharacterized protein
MQNINRANQSAIKLIIILVTSLAIFASNLYTWIPRAYAHRPHRVVDQLELSHNYGRNQILFIIVRGIMFKSEDGGNHWERLWKGLDNSDNLVALSLSYKNDNILFASSLNSGIYKSIDGGQSWEKANNGLDLKKTKINLLEISPNSDQLALAVDSNQKVFKTNNGGKSWELIYDNGENSTITTISFIPNQIKSILIGDSSGNIRLSKDEGATWDIFLTLDNNAPITSIQASPQYIKDKTVFIGTKKHGLYKSTQGQLSREDKKQVLSKKIIQDIAISPNFQADLTLFISSWHEGIYRSKDGGKTWEKHSKGLTKSKQADEEQFSSPHFREIRISNDFARDKTLLLTGFDGLFKSKDEGENWQSVNSLSRDIVIGIALSPNYYKDSTLAVIDYVGTAHISYDAGKSWNAMKTGLELPRFTKSLQVPIDDPRRFFDIAFSPNYKEDNTLFLGFLRKYTAKSSDRGRNWNIVAIPDVPKTFVRGTFLAPSPNIGSDKLIYMATNAGTLYQSTDRGNNFAILAQLKTRITSLLISPNFFVDKTLYVSGFDGIYKSIDRGNTWTSTTQNLPLKNLTWSSLAISPNYQEDKTLFAGSNQGVYLTKDAGLTWLRLDTLPYGSVNEIAAIAISPNYKNDRTFIVTIQGKGTFKTSNDGQMFTPIGKGEIYLARINTIPSASIPIQFSPQYEIDNTIYGFGSAEAEIYQSIDGGITWNTIKIPAAKGTLFDYLNRIQFLIYADRIHLLKLIIAIFMAVLSYIIIGYLKSIKQLRSYILPLKFLGTSIIFIIAILILF